MQMGLKMCWGMTNSAKVLNATVERLLPDTDTGAQRASFSGSLGSRLAKYLCLSSVGLVGSQLTHEGCYTRHLTPR